MENITLEIFSEPKSPPQYIHSESVKSDSRFFDIIYSILKQFQPNLQIEMNRWKLKTGRSERTSYFPIGANADQMNTWNREQKKKRIEISVDELQWPYSEILQKYKTRFFHIEKSK